MDQRQSKYTIPTNLGNILPWRDVSPDTLWVCINDEKMAIHYLKSECIGPSDLMFLVFGDVQSNASVILAVYVYNLIRIETFTKHIIH